MTTTMKVIALLGLLALLAPSGFVSGGALEAQQRASPAHGAQIRVEHGGSELLGELLAVDAGHVWMLGANERFLALPRTGVHQIRMQRHDWDGGRIARWGLIAGGVTTVAMLSACSRVNGIACGAVAASWALAWAGVAGLSALFMQPTRRFDPSDWGELRPYARFPQGLPEGYGVSDSVTADANRPDP